MTSSQIQTRVSGGTTQRVFSQVKRKHYGQFDVVFTKLGNMVGFHTYKVYEPVRWLGPIWGKS